MSLFKKNQPDNGNTPKDDGREAQNEARKIPDTITDGVNSTGNGVHDNNTSGMAGPYANPSFHTPDGFDFNRYFLADRRISLDNVSYEVAQAHATGGLKLGIKDTVLAQLMGTVGVKVSFNRALRFDPDGPFTLSVTFSVMLVFNPGTRGEINWKTIDLADEFKKNCPQLMQVMAAKSSLLVAEITNAANGNPIIPVKI